MYVCIRSCTYKDVDFLALGVNPGDSPASFSRTFVLPTPPSSRATRGEVMSHRLSIQLFLYAGPVPGWVGGLPAPALSIPLPPPHVGFGLGLVFRRTNPRSQLRR